MPSLPIVFPVVLDGGDLPVEGTEDVLAVYPAETKGGGDAPVRDAIIEAEAAMFGAWQEASAYASLQSDPLTATGIYLDGLASDRSIYRQQGESDDSLRQRIISVPDVVTPAAIVALANSILAPYSDIECQYFESSTDRLFLPTAGTVNFRSFVGAPPDYTDRHYSSRPNSSPGGAWVFGDMDGRYFVLRVPVLNDQSGAHTYPMDGTSTADPYPGAWIHDSSGTGVGTVRSYISLGASSALDIYQTIVNSIEQIRGHGIRWMLYADPKLV